MVMCGALSMKNGFSLPENYDKNEEWDEKNASRDDFLLQIRALFILEDGASVAKIWGVKDGSDDATVEQIRKRAKWDNNDYVCRGLILNGMSNSLFDIYQNVESFKELWDSLEAKYEDASSKKFLVSNFTNYKMTDSRPVMEQYNELLGVLGRFTQHKMNMDEAIQVSCIIDKLPPSWKDFKHTLKHLKEELTLIELGSHLCIEESLRMQDSDKPKGNNVVGPSVVNTVEHNNSSRYNDNKGKRKHHDNTRADPNKKSKVTCWKCGKPGHVKKDCKGGKVGNKANGSGTNGSVDGSTNSLKGKNMFNKSFQVYYVTYVSEAYFVQDDDVEWWVDSGATIHVFKDRYWFKTYESLNNGSILHIGNESTTLVHGRGSVDLRAVVRLPDPNLKTLGERGIECIFVRYDEHSKAFRFYVIEPNDSVLINSIIESRDAIFDENKFSSVPRPSPRIPNETKDIGGSVVPEEITEEDGPKIFDEAIKSQDVAFWKEAINDEMDFIMDNNTWVLADLPPGSKFETLYVNNVDLGYCKTLCGVISAVAMRDGAAAEEEGMRGAPYNFSRDVVQQEPAVALKKSSSQSHNTITTQRQSTLRTPTTPKTDARLNSPVPLSFQTAWKDCKQKKWESIKRIKGEALKEKDDPGAFIFPIRLEGQVNENALADTGSDINTMPFRIYVQLGRDDMKKVERVNQELLNHTPGDKFYGGYTGEMFFAYAGEESS
ncbi:zinc finger, CCHC-type containing protein [Tanacetum coccineum]